MNQTGDQQDVVRAEAADWFARLKSLPVSRETLEGFFAWRREPAHAEAFAAVERVWTRTGSVAEDPAIAALTEDAYRRAGRRSPGGARFKLVPMAAIVIALGVLGTVLAWDRGGHAYTTRIGEQSVVALDDGSKITLDSDSRVVVRLSGGARRVELDHGRALFAVAHDANRPFTVRAGGTEVLATGTRFDVRRLGDLIDVTLVEGKVEVRSPDATVTALGAGQQWTRRADRTPVVRSVQTSAEIAWTERRIVFDGTALAAAIAEVNRYATRPVHLDSTRHAEDQVSGSFRMDDPGSFAAAVAGLLPLDAVEQADGSIRLVDRRPTFPENRS
jgi:transmembrane sensor